ncbi:anhydro-N-acetylmuramic acid kinase [Vibrio panuliri]|uniref:Anhydro-N-acetylmuramic acid kinase n=1 Tax=Vibrio panuliri TaxID=1381081 RepID=A0A1Q9H9C8_9VIBR|nr:anhydro-N-acetylmuramic acid kinase [Vibrio panuliri]OLQ85580.1 anhydro-N-acetylmuramic acid kinase [Vibrio panuliri]
MSTKQRFIGVMSGTSMDAVDTALVEIEDNRIELLAALDFPFPADLKQRLLAICLGQETNLAEVGELDHLLGHLFADAVNALLKHANLDAADITAIGNHGQTVYHRPDGQAPFTMQIGDANIIATKTGINTVADFRRKDMALGGQGAPLVPAFHKSIFSAKESSVVVLNIGGIANISVLRPNQPVIGYDTGPGNMLMDAWCELHRQTKFDKDAQFALEGRVHSALLAQLMNEPYLKRSAPKSTGRELFNLPWLEQQLSAFSLSPQDVQRTLCEYTAVTIANEVTRFVVGDQPELLVCGGGVRNPLIMQRLNELLPSWNVTSTQHKGVDSDNMEAMAFAWLAQRRIHNLPSNLPEVTGARQLASLGVLYFADQ